MIVQLKDGQQVARYETVAEAAEATNTPATNIYAVLRGTRVTAGGCEWKITQTVAQRGTDPEVLEGEYSFEQGADFATLSGVVIDEPDITHEELVARFKVDLKKWEYVEHTFRTWTTTLKKKLLIDPATGKQWVEGVPFSSRQPVSAHEIHKVTNTGFVIKFRLRSEFREKLVEQLKEHIGVLPRKKVPQKKGQLLAELMITDHHLGKQGFDPETLELTWSIEEALGVYQDIVDFTLSRLPLNEVERFILPTGNDLLHVDSNLGTTTKGTQISNECFWLNLFRYGKEAVVCAIDRLLEYAPVTAVFIPGNHDFNGVLALSEVIRTAYSNNPNVEIMSSARGREWYKYGKNLLGWHHGNSCTPQKALTAMMADVPHWIGETTFRTVHVGHLHTSIRTESISLKTLEEVPGLIYEVCPTVTPTDRWHDRNLFVGNLRRTKTFVYNKAGGLEQEIIFNKR